MIQKMRLPILSFTFLFLLSPVAGVAQESLSDADELEPTLTSQPATNQEVLRPSAAYAALLLPPPAESLPIGAEELQPDDTDVPAVPVPPSKGSGTGLGFMIGGAAALVGGLLIGGTGGNIIAAGGVALGVYGAIVYF